MKKQIKRADLEFLSDPLKPLAKWVIQNQEVAENRDKGHSEIQE